MSRHAWERNVVIPERRLGGQRIIPEMMWFPRCKHCGCLHNGTHYRATPTSEWTPDEPECTP